MRENPQLPGAKLGPWATLVSLLPHLWPRGRTGLRVRVGVALTLLAAAKLVNVAVPFLYKAAVDALDVKPGHLVILLPVMAIFAYGAARVGAQAFGELRDAVFAKVAQAAVRSVGLSVFRHLHALSLRFHLERQTGGLTRDLERGSRGISQLVSYALYSILPTLV